MNTRVINDPVALGWEFDPDTGRWAYGADKVILTDTAETMFGINTPQQEMGL